MDEAVQGEGNELLVAVTVLIDMAHVELHGGNIVGSNQLVG